MTKEHFEIPKCYRIELVCTEKEVFSVWYTFIATQEYLDELVIRVSLDFLYRDFDKY